MIPAFGPLPGGPELVVILLVVFVLFGPVVLAVAALLSYGDDDEVAELRERVSELEAQMGADGGDDESAGDGGHGDDAGDGGSDEATDAAGRDSAATPDRQQ
ncbi:MAG: twin-arginine translocase TatA/TatE family subunit [Halolamina sp.]